ncbi:hypothetical protein IWQ49_006130, partial [Labrenzia sp. EL_126]|nr:hypothetical protein [Labrenzia sp. EL_126]
MTCRTLAAMCAVERGDAAEHDEFEAMDMRSRSRRTWSRANANTDNRTIQVVLTKCRNQMRAAARLRNAAKDALVLSYRVA